MEDIIGNTACQAEEKRGMTLTGHKRLTDLAYRVKDFIDGNGGLSYDEACQFGYIMANIINLK